LRSNAGDSAVEFEYDEAKSRANVLKHGIDFAQAQEMWNDADMVVAPARDSGERRFLVVARIGAVHWSAIVTFRSERIRIISVRRARVKEVSRYEGE
jgi:uncharacterized DUF497 family protein